MVELSDFLYDDEGMAISGATVEVFAKNTTTPVVSSTTTNSSGFWTFSGLAQNEYDVRLTDGSTVRWRKHDIEWQIALLETAALRMINPAGTFVGIFAMPAITANRTYTLPSTSGTLALTSDITGTTRYMQAEVFNMKTPETVTTGNGQWYFPIPPDFNGLNLTYVHAQVVTAGVTGTMDIQIAKDVQGTDMLSTKLTVDSGDRGSHSAATPAVIDTANDDVATNDLLRVDIDAVHTTPPQGLIVTVGFKPPS